MLLRSVAVTFFGTQAVSGMCERILWTGLVGWATWAGWVVSHSCAGLARSLILTMPLCPRLSRFPLPHILFRPRWKMWDRPSNSSQKGRLLGTAVIWRWAIPAVLMEHAARSQQEVPVVEVVAVCVEEGCSRERYPFCALLYQSTMYERYNAMHFDGRPAPTHMAGLGGEKGNGGDEAVTRRAVLWDYRYLSE